MAEYRALAQAFLNQTIGALEGGAQSVALGVTPYLGVLFTAPPPEAPAFILTPQSTYKEMQGILVLQEHGNALNMQLMRGEEASPHHSQITPFFQELEKAALGVRPSEKIMREGAAALQKVADSYAQEYAQLEESGELLKRLLRKESSQVLAQGAKERLQLLAPIVRAISEAAEELVHQLYPPEHRRQHGRN